MHELSIALGIVELAQQEALKNNANQVTEIEIEIGRLSGVDIESLSFVLESVVRNTLLEGCHITILPISGRCKCHVCGQEFEIADLLTPCPFCESYQKELIAGKELKLKSLLID